MTIPTAVTSPLRYARVAAFGYLVVFVLGFFGVYVESFIVPGDAATTTSNIMASELLFRMGIVTWLIVLAADAVVAWALYYLLEPANRSLSLLAAWFRLVFVAIFGINMLNRLMAVQLLGGADDPQMMLFLSAHDYGVNIAFVFFGIHIGVIGYLIFKSGYIPRIVGLLLMVVCVGYMIDSFASFLSSNYVSNQIAFILFVAVPAVISELSLTIWLLWKGVNVEVWKKRALESA